MKKRLTIWLLALLLLLSGCGAVEATELALPDSSDAIVSEEIVQKPQSDKTDSGESKHDKPGRHQKTDSSPS